MPGWLVIDCKQSYAVCFVKWQAFGFKRMQGVNPTKCIDGNEKVKNM